MFDRVRRPPELHINWRILAVAVLGASSLTLGLGWLCLWVLSILGYTNLPPGPVEVSYTPYGDGRTLEQIQAEEDNRPVESEPDPAQGAQ